MNIRLSVTDLDSYFYWLDTEGMSFDDLLLRLRGKSPPTEPMMAGRAFHKLFEKAIDGIIASEEVDGFTFEFAIDQAIHLPPVRELKGETVIDTPAGQVTLVGKVDAINGLIVHDYKLTERFDAERYTDSYQWRCYLTMFHSHTFVYDVFQGRYDGRAVTIYDYHRLPLYAYPKMRADVERAVGALADIVAKHVPEKVAA